MQNDRLGIVVPTYNRLTNIKLLLRSLELQTCSNFYLVVVDDGSTDGTGKYILDMQKKFFWQERLKWVEGGENCGFRAARARNIGVANLPECAMIVFFDSDIIIPADFLEKLVGLHHNFPNALILTRTEWLPRLDTVCLEDTLNNFRWDELMSLIPQGVPQRLQGTFVGHDLRLELEDNPFSKVGNALVPLNGDWFLLLNIAIPADLFRQTGGFDENFEGYGYEDIDFGIRAERAGMSCVVCNEMYAFHVWHKKEDDFATLVQNQYNLNLLIQKHGITNKLRKEVDFRFWWHYTKKRNGKMLKNNNQLWVIDESETYRLRIDNPSWVSRLGYTNSEFVVIDDPALQRFIDMGFTETNYDYLIPALVSHPDFLVVENSERT